jgi:hypothetical protein
MALSEGLASDAALRVLPDAGIEHGVGDGVADFVRMTFANGFGSKNETA